MMEICPTSAELKEVEYLPEKLIKIYERINQFRQEKVYCDVNIRVRKDTVYAHGGVLCAHSCYFKDVLRNIKGEKEIELYQLDPLAVKNCVDYMYTGHMEIKFENIAGVAEAAKFLGVTGVVKLCEKAFRSYIDVERAMTIRKFASYYGYEEVLKDASLFLMQNFLPVLKSNIFLEYTDDELAWLIDNRDLSHKPMETLVWCAIVKWVKHDLAERERDFPCLLQLIDLDNLPVAFMNENIRTEPIVMRSDACVKFLLHHLFTRVACNDPGL